MTTTWKKWNITVWVNGDFCFFRGHQKGKRMKECKIQQLSERYNEYCSNSEDGQGDGMSFEEYVEREADNNPRFFAWLFDAEGVERFDDLKEEQKTELKKLLKK